MNEMTPTNRFKARVRLSIEFNPYVEDDWEEFDSYSEDVPAMETLPTFHTMVVDMLKHMASVTASSTELDNIEKFLDSIQTLEFEEATE